MLNYKISYKNTHFKVKLTRSVTAGFKTRKRPDKPVSNFSAIKISDNDMPISQSQQRHKQSHKLKVKSQNSKVFSFNLLALSLYTRQSNDQIFRTLNKDINTRK
jgi:hypothetical protein